MTTLDNNIIILFVRMTILYQQKNIQNCLTELAARLFLVTVKLLASVCVHMSVRVCVVLCGCNG